MRGTILRMAKRAEWESRVASWRASGLSSNDFCKGRGYSPKSLLWWSCQLRRSEGGKPAKTTDVRLARVIRAPSPSSAAPAVLIEFEGARVAVGGGASAETLRAVFEALRGRSAP